MPRPVSQRLPGEGVDESDILDLALLAVAVLASLAALVTDQWLVAIVGALPSLAGDLLRTRRPDRYRTLARALHLERPARSLVRNGAVVIGVTAVSSRGTVSGTTALLIAVLAGQLALAGYTALAERRVAAEATAIEWRNLDVGGRRAGPDPLPDPVRRHLPLDGLRAIAIGEAAVLAGF